MLKPAALAMALVFSGGALAGQTLDIGGTYSRSVCGNSSDNSAATIGSTGTAYANCTLSPNDNTLNINNATVNGYGAYGAYDSGDVANNTVNVYNSAGGTSHAIGTGVAGGYSSGGRAIGNKVFIHSTGVIGAAYGGYGEGDVSNNRVTMNGGRSYALYGGYSVNGNATDNHVVINGGNIPSSWGIAGGRVQSGNGTATGNTVTITGGTFYTSQFDIYGGRHDNNGSATHNTITVSGAPVNIQNAQLSGGYSGTGDAFTGNTLNIHDYSGANSVSSIANFEFFNFILPASVGNGATVLYTNQLTLGNSGTKSRVTGVIFRGNMNVGDGVTLIDSANAATGAGLDETPSGVDGKVGLRNAKMTATYDTMNYNVLLRIDSIDAGAPAGTQSLPEGFISGAAFINQATDFIADRGMIAAIREAARADRNLFAALSGGSLRYNTGSHVDVDGYSLLVGTSVAIPSAPLVLGAFVEHGEGDYDSYNSLAAGRFRGKGDTRYTGLGMLAHLEVDKALYLEGSLRGGRVKTSYDSGDFGQPVAYDARSGYMSAHAGIGYRLAVSERSALKFYGQYLWSRQDGDKVTLTNGDPVKFAAVESQRARLGAKLDFAVNKHAAAWLGAAWEYEFDGKARARYYDDPIDAPELKGDTGMLEVGFTITPAANQPLTLDFGLQGYAGKREGATGSFRVNYAF
jgi:hypothetical protein